MNELEKLQAYVAILEQRVRKLEINFTGLATMRSDEREAQLVAQELGFPVDVVRLAPRANQEAELIRRRRRIARELKAKGWSIERISRSLNCAARTVARWLE